MRNARVEIARRARRDIERRAPRNAIVRRNAPARDPRRGGTMAYRFMKQATHACAAIVFAWCVAAGAQGTAGSPPAAVSPPANAAPAAPPHGPIPSKSETAME